MEMEHRDLTPEESRRYRNPSVFTDPTVRIVFTDPGFEEQPILYKGFVESTPGFVRRWKLIEKGMLLQVECRPFVLWDYLVKEELDMSIMLKLSEEEAAEYRRPIPDLVHNYSLDLLPDFTQEKLTEYIHGFTERSIDLLKMDQKTAEFVRRNQGGVISYLVNKLEAGHHLSFYRAGRTSPLKHGPIAIVDLTDPQKPILLYLVYGLRPLLWEPPKGPHAYIPWMPCLESSEEA